jgi:flagellar biosynthesis protein FlhB
MFKWRKGAIMRQTYFKTLLFIVMSSIVVLLALDVIYSLAQMRSVIEWNKAEVKMWVK